jgi:iron(III) transport system substrate-binding protein
MPAILRRGLLGSALLALVVACGCSERESGDAATGGSGESEILVYTAIEDDQLPVMLDAFRAKHPDINVKTLRNSTGIVTAKVLAEADNPQADMIWGLAVTSMMLIEERGITEPYAPAGVERIPAEFRDDADPPHWVGTSAWMTAICCNTIEMEKRDLPMPRSLADLTKPIYRGLVAAPNPASSGTGYLTVSAVLQMMGEEEGWAFLDRLHENILVYTHSGSKPAKLAGQGECVIGISFGFRGLRQKSLGEPLEVIFPAEGSGWDLETCALIRKDEIKPAVKTFYDWAISSEAMHLYAEDYGLVTDPEIREAPEGFPEDPRAQIIENDFAWAAENRERILAEWNRRYATKSEPSG